MTAKRSKVIPYLDSIDMPFYDENTPDTDIRFWHMMSTYDAAFPATIMTILSRLMHAPWLPFTFEGFDDYCGQGWPFADFAKHFGYPYHPCFEMFTLVPLDARDEWWRRVDADPAKIPAAWAKHTVLVPVVRDLDVPLPHIAPIEFIRILRWYYVPIRADLAANKDGPRMSEKLLRN